MRINNALTWSYYNKSITAPWNLHSLYWDLSETVAHRKTAHFFVVLKTIKSMCFFYINWRVDHKYCLFPFLCSPEPKAFLIKIYPLSSLSLCHCCRRRCRKLFTFLSSSPEPLGQFQPNLAQSILGWRGFTFFQIKGPALSKGQIITKWWKYIVEIKNYSSPEPLSQISTKIGAKHSWVKGIQVCSN